jgi:hypothetical protein
VPYFNFLQMSSMFSCMFADSAYFYYSALFSLTSLTVYPWIQFTCFSSPHAHVSLHYRSWSLQSPQHILILSESAYIISLCLSWQSHKTLSMRLSGQLAMTSLRSETARWCPPHSFSPVADASGVKYLCMLVPTASNSINSLSKIRFSSPLLQVSR